ncbi:MAG: Signal transduction histidine kinase [Moraxellaceae bacterium]|jgi:two-component system sensor histidine kinase RegB|nr:Signal transduction histidine kinase [Moraxellaceae bacterium]
MPSPALFDWMRAPAATGKLRYLAHYLGSLTVVIATLGYTLESHWHIALPQAAFWTALLGHLALTLVAWHRTLLREDSNTGLYLAVLLLSTLLLGSLLQAAGGHTNPLISLLLLPVAMGAATLRWQATVLLALTTLALYAVLMRWYEPLQGQHGMHGHAQFMELHLLGMWLTFLLSVALLVGVVLPLTVTMQRQQEQIARQREQMLRDERLVALATFAASVTHQLGTPLSTLAVLVDDLQQAPKDAAQAEDLALMTRQVGHCKSILQSLAQRADDVRQGRRQRERVAYVVQRLREQFALLHPARQLRLAAPAAPDWEVLCDVTLEQALLNLLDNAAQAGAGDPQLDLQREGDWLCLRLRDEGSGIPEAIRAQLGQPFVSSRSGGTGLGLFLSHASIERLGGTLRLESSGTGTLAEVRLPLAPAGSGLP